MLRYEAVIFVKENDMICIFYSGIQICLVKFGDLFLGFVINCDEIYYKCNIKNDEKIVLIQVENFW